MKAAIPLKLKDRFFLYCIHFKMKNAFVIVMAFVFFSANGQVVDPLVRFTMYTDVKITIDAPLNSLDKKEKLVILYALPNGNTTEQTMGKKLAPGDDWHFDIQHIKAQTEFIRKELPHKTIVVVYL